MRSESRAGKDDKNNITLFLLFVGLRFDELLMLKSTIKNVISK